MSKSIFIGHWQGKGENGHVGYMITVNKGNQDEIRITMWWPYIFAKVPQSKSDWSGHRLAMVSISRVNKGKVYICSMPFSRLISSVLALEHMDQKQEAGVYFWQRSQEWLRTSLDIPKRPWWTPHPLAELRLPLPMLRSWFCRRSVRTLMPFINKPTNFSFYCITQL